MSFTPPQMPVAPIATRTAKNFIDDVNEFSSQLSAAIQEIGREGQTFIDFPSGKSVRMNNMFVPRYAKNASTIVVIGHDENDREVHILTTYEQLSYRVEIITKSQQSQQPE